jgi:serine/threonine-protein kinase
MADEKEPFLEEGTVLGDKWVIQGHIASGGKGEVYLARQKSLERDVAVKIMSPSFMAEMAEHEGELEAELERFKREVLLMASLRHPNVIQIYDYDRAEIEGQELEYIAMEYIPGPTLRLTMPEEGMGQDGSRAEADLRQWLRRYYLPLLDGMEVVHGAGIVHRDMKPENVLLDNDAPKIADFGLARGLRLDNVTRSHHILGTMPYMPPEQFIDLPLTDARADVYALGKMLYEAVVGKLRKENAFALKAAHLPEPQTPFFRRVDRIVRQATAEDRAERLPSVQALREALLHLLEDQEPPWHAAETPAAAASYSRERLWMGLALAVLLLLVAGVVYHFRFQVDGTAEQAPQSREPAPATTRPGPAAEQPQEPAAPALPEQVQGRDGAILHLVPQATVEHVGPDGEAETVRAGPFYLERTEVTNHQYAEFLNQVPDRVREKDGVVYGDGDIWLLLEGDGMVRRGERFGVEDPALASHPVVRVTAYGAQAYARHFGRRLPDAAEFHVAAAQAANATADAAVDHEALMDAPEHEPDPSMHEAMMRQLREQSPPVGAGQGPAPVSEFPAGPHGVRGLGANVREWVRLVDKQGFGLLGDAGDDLRPKALRPYESFGDVGFRTAKTPEREVQP